MSAVGLKMNIWMHGRKERRSEIKILIDLELDRALPASHTQLGLNPRRKSFGTLSTVWIDSRASRYVRRIHNVQGDHVQEYRRNGSAVTVPTFLLNAPLGNRELGFAAPFSRSCVGCHDDDTAVDGFEVQCNMPTQRLAVAQNGEMWNHYSLSAQFLPCTQNSVQEPTKLKPSSHAITFGLFLSAMKV
ncbi:hypothetical protein K438DRAFT_1759847 [Mycena galopus ATCC 62051]|nr:hypothetical protein K438DRAFT_1759847 [Mycena galopus ATCC 62051]